MDDATFRWLLVVFAVWAAVILALLLIYIYKASVSASTNVVNKYTRLYSTVTTVHPTVSQDASTVGACPVLMSSMPSKNITRGRTVCFEVGKHSDVTKELTFRPRYIRVSAGYTLIAYGQKYFGEPVQFKMVGPQERIIQQDNWALDVLSVIVHMSIAPSPDTESCKLGAIVDNEEICLSQGTHPTFPGTPTTANLHAGYRATVFPNTDLAGGAVHSFVGPHTYSNESPAQTTEGQRWRSISIEPCGVTLYSEVNAGGKRRLCTRNGIATLDFQPKSVFISDGCTLQAFPKAEFLGQMIYTSATVGISNIPTESLKTKWASVNVECPDLSGKVRDRATAVGDQRPRSPCVSLSGIAFLQASTSSMQMGKSTGCLETGAYIDLPAILGFVPTSIQVPQGLRIKVKNRVGEEIMSITGPKSVDVTSGESWYDVIILTVHML